MGNGFEIDLNKYKCSCFQTEDNCFINFINGNSKDPFNFITTPDKLSASELQENTPGGLRYPNDNMVKSSLRKKETMNKRKKINLFNDELEKETNDDNIEGKKTYNNTNQININDQYDEEQKENDLKDFDKKTNYFLLANQVNNAINELKLNLWSNNKNTIINSTTPISENDSIIENKNLNFDKIIKKAGKKADKIIFNDIINCVKKITDIHSEVILIKEKIYLGIVNKFKKVKDDKYLINYIDEEKIIDLPNFEDINEKYRLKLGKKFNNPKFKFNKFTIKGSFPNEILIWNLISQNTQKIVDILTENYYCCLILLFYSKVEEENETIMYLINKPNI